MVHLLDRENLMTTAEVGKYLHIKPKTVTVWLREGRLPGIKLKPSGQWRVSPERLHVWEKQQENI
jgi:excisionase family DNA binding protein